MLTYHRALRVSQITKTEDSCYQIKWHPDRLSVRVDSSEKSTAVMDVSILAFAGNRNLIQSEIQR